MKVAFAGGGTGGHLYPAIALAGALRNRAQILFIGSEHGLESTIIPEAGYELETVKSRPLRRGLSFETLKTAAANAAGIAQSLRILRAFGPDLIVATGGYVSFPPVSAARLLKTMRMLRAALVLIEPNARPGLANRMLAPLVDEVWGAFPAAGAIFGSKYVHTGVPVRASLMRPSNRIEAARRFGLDPARRTILAVGGSQGARTLNEAMAALVTRRALPANWQVLHLSGERDHAMIAAEERRTFGENRVALLPYVEDMADAYALSDLVVARAGASTIAELCALGLPSVLVPYPFAAENHQAVNAEMLASRGAAVVIEDRSLSADSLWWTLRDVMQTDRLDAMRSAARSLGSRDATAAILARVQALLSKNNA